MLKLFCQFAVIFYSNFCSINFNFLISFLKVIATKIMVKPLENVTFPLLKKFYFDNLGRNM